MKFTSIIFLVMIGLNSLAQEKQLSDFQWKNRIVLVSTESKSLLFDDQKSELAKEENGLKERKILILESSEVKLSKALKRKLQISNILLIGLDGGVKSQRETIFNVKDLFTIIDGMPMRRSEIRGSGKS